MPFFDGIFSEALAAYRHKYRHFDGILLYLMVQLETINFEFLCSTEEKSDFMGHYK
jgi:hypothetical protein